MQPGSQISVSIHRYLLAIFSKKQASYMYMYQLERHLHNVIAMHARKGLYTSLLKTLARGTESVESQLRVLSE